MDTDADLGLSVSGSPNVRDETGVGLPSGRMVKYPFPLRNNACCFFEVPRDLTENEVKRITNYLLSLSKIDL